jgi:Zn ribbon nucleic-acid-binding protein
VRRRTLGEPLGGEDRFPAADEDRCPVCGDYGHPTETDEQGRHPGCAYAEGSVPLVPCFACGAETPATELAERDLELPDAAGTIREAVCPGCSAALDRLAQGGPR